MNQIMKDIKYYMRDQASEKFKDRYNFDLKWDMEFSAIYGDIITPQDSVKSSIKRYITRNPEEFNPIFVELFTEEEIKDLSQSLRGAA